MWSWMKGVEDEEEEQDKEARVLSSIVSVILFTCRIPTIPDAQDAAGESESRGVSEPLVGGIQSVRVKRQRAWEDRNCSLNAAPEAF